MSTSSLFHEKVIVVTGAAGGIGREVCRILRNAGADVAMADLLGTEFDTTTNGNPDSHQSGYEVDITSQESCDNLVRAIQIDFGHIDGLVNAAGVIHQAEAALTTDADLSTVLDINAIGTFRMCRAVYPSLVLTGGAIVNIASTNGLVAVPQGCAYGMSKAAVIQLTRSLALEWASHHIRVNAVAPTIVPTSMNATMRDDASYLETKLKTIPLARMVRAEEVAAAVKFLLSPLAGMITGHTMPIDGGLLIQ